VILNNDIELFTLRLIVKSFTAKAVEIAGNDVTFFNIIPTEQLSDCEFSDLVTDNDVTNAVLMMYDDSAHESFLLAV